MEHNLQVPSVITISLQNTKYKWTCQVTASEGICSFDWLKIQYENERKHVSCILAYSQIRQVKNVSGTSAITMDYTVWTTFTATRGVIRKSSTSMPYHVCVKLVYSMCDPHITHCPPPQASITLWERWPRRSNSSLLMTTSSLISLCLLFSLPPEWPVTGLMPGESGTTIPRTSSSG